MNIQIIAEAGVNHNGDINLAKKLIDVAYESKADFIKFQTYRTEKLVSINAEKAVYQKRNLRHVDNKQFSMLKDLELSFSNFSELKKYADNKGIGFLSSGFDEESIDFLDILEVRYFKIPSGELTNKPLLEHIARKGRPIILSTGMSEISEIRDSMEVLINNGVRKEDIIVLHCNTQYPTLINDVNLLSIQYIAEQLNVKVGYSDHTIGIEIPIAASALGACIIEKHITLDRNLPGPDHRASAEPDELKLMIKLIRNVELALGSKEKIVGNSERENLRIARRSIHALNDMKIGDKVKQNDLIMLRPGDGISPMDYEKIIGKEIIRNIPAGNKIQPEDLK